jgi:transposase InsO family protein
MLLDRFPAGDCPQTGRFRPVKATPIWRRLFDPRLEALGIRGSMSRKANPYDNALAESFMKTLKHEEVLEFSHITACCQSLSSSLRLTHSAASVPAAPESKYRLT